LFVLFAALSADFCLDTLHFIFQAFATAGITTAWTSNLKICAIKGVSNQINAKKLTHLFFHEAEFSGTSGAGHAADRVFYDPIFKLATLKFKSNPVKTRYILDFCSVALQGTIAK
jgi:hypothetical protein